ncbi:MAG TPA: TMEM175 family protein [Anaerolineae bacterium]|nr:TMEM175 family protein [Anaerolineae bacterium]HNU03671.1 TMEM175 family protein [Anaerolineae bacterium]
MDTNRIEAFSDGVFAIAITLLVLEFKIPAIETLGLGLLRLWPSYLAYAMSFIVVGAIWINHHTMFDWIVRADQKLLLLNTLHLMFIAFLPFPTAVLAEAFHTSSSQDVATAFYAGTLTLIGVLATAMWRYAASQRELLDPAVSPEQAKAIEKRFLIGPIGYGVATILAFINPWLSIALFIGINAFYLWPRRFRVTA